MASHIPMSWDMPITVLREVLPEVEQGWTAVRTVVPSLQSAGGLQVESPDPSVEASILTDVSTAVQ